MPLTRTARNAHARSKQLEDELRQLQEDRRIGLQREEDLRCALKEAEKRLQALKAECTAARVFGEIEDAEGKGAFLVEARPSILTRHVLQSCSIFSVMWWKASMTSPSAYGRSWTKLH